MIEILPLKYEHCEQVYEIAKDCIPEYWSIDGIRDVLKYDNNIYYVAVCCGKGISDGDDRKIIYGVDDNTIEPDRPETIVGFGGIMIVADESELLNIAVKDAYRKQGIASMLIDELLTAAKKSGAYRMLLEVREHNDAAKKMYMKHGFTVLGNRNNYYSNPVDNALIMEKVFD